MQDNGFTHSQILAILREVKETGRIDEICRRQDISIGTLCRWQRRYGLMNAHEERRLRAHELEEEKAWLKRLLIHHHGGRWSRKS